MNESLDAGQHVDGVTKDRARFEGDLDLVHHEADALLGGEANELVDAKDMLARTPEVLQLVRMVDHAGVVGVLVVDLDWMDVR